MQDLIKELNAPEKDQRLKALSELNKLIKTCKIDMPEKQEYTNNHVHTKYSFSPYSPAKAVWMAAKAGLSTVGIIDHDAINGAPEFIEAGKILGIATTIGFEIRTDWSETPLAGRRLNNPDQMTSAYITAHGLPHDSIQRADEFLNGIRVHRHIRNEKMVCNINDIVSEIGMHIDYKKDVLPLSYSDKGGGVTERHILFALALKMVEKFKKGQELIDILSNEMGIKLAKKQLEYLSDTSSDIYEYDLLNVLKSSFIKDIYVDAQKGEAVPVGDTVKLIRELGAIPTYCYLGDVEESPTGDKKAQKFEDDYLEDVFQACRDIGFQAIAYMPSRNTMAQLKRVMAMCEKYGFMQISGEDINQPRQSFICEKLIEPEFQHLSDTTWALVGHEKSETKERGSGMFSDCRLLSMEELKERIEKFKKIGMSK